VPFLLAVQHPPSHALSSLSPDLVDGKWTFTPPKPEPPKPVVAAESPAIAKCQYWCSAQADKFKDPAARVAICNKVECSGCDFCATAKAAMPSTTSGVFQAEMGHEPRLLIAHGCSQSTVVGHIFFHIAKASGLNFLATRCKEDVHVSGCGGGRDEEGLKHEKNAFCGAQACDWPAAINATVAEVVANNATLFLQGGPVHVHMEGGKPMWYHSMGDWDQQIAGALLKLHTIPAGVLRCNQLDKAICEVRDGFYTDFGNHGLGMTVGWKVKWDTGVKVEHTTGGDISIRDVDKTHQDKAFMNKSAIKQYLTTYSEDNLRTGIRQVFTDQGYHGDEIPIECAEDLLKFTQSDSQADLDVSQASWRRLLEGWKLSIPETKLAEMLNNMEESPGKKYRNSFALRDTGEVVYNSEEVVTALSEIDRLDLWRGPASPAAAPTSPTATPASPAAIPASPTATGGSSHAAYLLSKHARMQKEAMLAASQQKQTLHGQRP